MKQLHIRKMVTFGASNIYYIFFEEGNINQPLFVLSDFQAERLWEEYFSQKEEE